MARKQFLINYHTSGATNPSVENVKLGEIVVKHNNEKPELVTLKNNGTFATFVDEKAIDIKLSAVTIDLTGEIQGVASKVTELSGGVATELAKYDTRDVAEGKIATAKADAVASATTYADDKLAAAESALTQDIQDVAGRVEKLEKLSGATESAIQVIAVSGIEGVEVVESGTTRTIDFDGMIIDGGEY